MVGLPKKCSLPPFGEVMPFVVLIVTVGIILIGYAVFFLMPRINRKHEIKIRHQHFNQLKEKTPLPGKAIEWLTEKLLGESSIGNISGNFHLTMEDLGISQEEYRDLILTCFERWKQQLKERVPTIREACHGPTQFSRQIERISRLMEIHGITVEEIKLDVQSLRAEYLAHCCTVIEDQLFYYPDRALQELPAPLLQKKLLEYWANPTPEQVQKWQDWVLLAKKRHAHRLLTRLRQGCYAFPGSNVRVTRLLEYLEKAGATPEAIGIKPGELEKLRFGARKQPRGEFL